MTLIVHPTLPPQPVSIPWMPPQVRLDWRSACILIFKPTFLIQVGGQTLSGGIPQEITPLR